MTLSFGLINVPTMFMDLINRVFRQYCDMSVIVFIDDIVIYSRGENTIVENLMNVLEILKD